MHKHYEQRCHIWEKIRILRINVILERKKNTKFASNTLKLKLVTIQRLIFLMGRFIVI